MTNGIWMRIAVMAVGLCVCVSAAIGRVDVRGRSVPPNAKIVVVPATVDPMAPLQPNSIVRLPLDQWTPLTFRARAFLYMDGSLVGDVSSLCEWTTNRPARITVIGPGEVLYPEWTVFTISAQYADEVRGEMYVVGANAAAYSRTFRRNDQPNPGSARVNGVPYTDITNRVLQGLRARELAGDRLAGRQLAVMELYQTRVVIDGSNLGPPLLAEGVPAGSFGRNYAIMNLWGYSNTGTSIVVSPSLAQALNNGQFTRETSDGTLTSFDLRTIQHEIFHIVSLEGKVGEADLDSDSTLPFSGVVHSFETNVADVTGFITTNPKPDTPDKRYKLRLKIDFMIMWYTQYYLDQPTDSPETRELKRQIRDIADRLGLKDADGNGIPDFIDDILRQWDIKYQDLPTTPPKIYPDLPPGVPDGNDHGLPKEIQGPPVTVPD